MPSTEIIFEVTEDETDGGYASAPGYGIHTQEDDWAELTDRGRTNRNRMRGSP